MFEDIIKLFDVGLKISDKIENSKTDRIAFNSCKAIIYDKTYSELDELSFANLNRNDYGFGYVEYEFSFLENFKSPYMKFYISCFALRSISISKNYTTKLNTPRPNRQLKLLNQKNYTKVNSDGNMSFGIRFYFRSEEERDAVLNSNEICIEGSVALGKKTNVYDIMCRIVRGEEGWTLDEAYTYRTNPKAHIYSLVH